MIREEILNLSLTNNKEKKLKLKLIEKVEESDISKIFYILAIKNQLLLNSCNINENEFNKILFKNYIYFLNTNKKFNIEKLAELDKETINIFKTNIENNNFEEALQIFLNNSIIYQYLCALYVKDINASEIHKINRIEDQNLTNVYQKLQIINGMNLTYQPNNIKIYQKISSK